jgi:hypothetical protein
VNGALDPLKMAKLGLTTPDIQNAILEQSQQAAAGKIGEAPAPAGTQFEYQINAQGELTNPQQFGNIVLRTATRNAAVLYLRDVARTDLGAMQYTESATTDQHPAVIIAIFATSTANALALDAAVRNEMATLAKRFLKGLAWGINYDTNMFAHRRADLPAGAAESRRCRAAQSLAASQRQFHLGAISYLPDCADFRYFRPMSVGTLVQSAVTSCRFLPLPPALRHV